MRTSTGGEIPNILGIIVGAPPAVLCNMAVTDPETEVRAALDFPPDAPTERLEVSDLGPPGPLKETLETLAELDDDTVLIQLNDRVPQHLYPRLTDRGYEFGTVERDDATITAIWKP